MKCLSVLALVWFMVATAAADDFSLCDSALAQLGLTCDEVRFDQDEMANWGGDLWRTHYFTMFHKNPFKLPKYGQLNLRRFSDDVTNITRLLSWAGARVDYTVYRGLIGDQLEKYTSPPDSIPRPSITGRKKVLQDEKFSLLRHNIDLLYSVVEDTTHFFVNTVDDLKEKISRQELFEYFVQESEEKDELIEELASDFDFSRLYAGAQDIAEAIKRMADSLEFASFPKNKTEMITDRGLIVVGTSGRDDYDYSIPPLLIIDGGGDDIYRFSGYPEKYPLSAIIDLSGNDKYVSTDTTEPGIGGALMGMSVVVDKAGDDYYEGTTIAQGCGIFGVGILLDYTGNDTYVAESYAQGCGAFGVGIMADSSGNDSLYCVILSQGFGYSKGCGLLIDYEGDDKYVAEDDSVINPSSQSKEHNSSLAQGVGFGKRADYIDGHSWAGGVGILCDIKGDDYYSAGLFAQGCAYWFAVGMLLDGGGNDSYNGIWYVQGSGAHFAVGYLDDFGGNDTYNAAMNMAIGAGHDFTTGYLNERGGDDTYVAPNLSLGGGNANGIGIFHDHSGDDTYTTQGGTTLGRANVSEKGAREYLHVFGIFLDGDGEDAYSEEYAKNHTRWIGPKTDPEGKNPYEVGVGIDR
ncbi:MAG: hypothetical protein JSV10_05395 [Candidatus Zixiibacteriota bacterium]|nr:MAG: hypothetical protein JSV10_05395 [candidate division Zixibacteria bacterium]